jgi:hypothetical protein
MTERERFFDALPFYVNGSLAAADGDWVRSYLERHPQLQDQLRFVQALEQEVVERAEATLHDVPVDVGYERLRDRVRTEGGGQQRAAATSFWQRARAWLAMPSPQGGRLAQGLALGLMLGVGAMIALPPLQHDDAAPVDVRSGGTALADGPLLRVTFDAAASESRLRLALIEARAIIVAGPTRLGDYYLKPAPGQLGAARDSLLRSGLVREAVEVPGLPAEMLE